MPYSCNNDDTDENECENCSITISQQPQLLYEQEQEQHPSPPNRRRRIFLFSGAAAAVVLLIVASIANTSAQGGGSAAIRQLFPSAQHRQGPAASATAAASVDVLDAREVLLMAERDALAFKRDAAGLQRTNDRLRAELLMPSQEAEVEEEAEARQQFTLYNVYRVGQRETSIFTWEILKINAARLTQMHNRCLRKCLSARMLLLALELPNSSMLRFTSLKRRP